MVRAHVASPPSPSAIRPLVAHQIRSPFKVSDRRSARFVGFYFLGVWLFVFVVLGLGPVPAKAKALMVERGPLELIASLSLLCLAGGASTFFAAWLAIGDELRYRRTLDILTVLRVPTGPIRPWLFGLLSALPIAVALYFTAMFWLYLAPSGITSIGGASLASLALLLVLIAAGASGLIVFLPVASAASSALFAAGGALVVAMAPAVVVFSRFPGIIPKVGLGVRGAGGSLATALIKSPVRVSIVMVPVALALVAVAYRTFASQIPRLESRRPSVASSPRVRLPLLSVYASCRQLACVLGLKDTALVLRSPGQVGLVALNAWMFGLLPLVLRVAMVLPPGSTGSRLVAVYCTGFAAFLAGLAATEVFLVEGGMLLLYRQAQRVWQRAMSCKLAAALIGSVLWSAPIAAANAFFGNAALSIWTAWLVSVIAAALLGAITAMRFGDFRARPAYVSLPGRSWYLLGAFVVTLAAVAVSALDGLGVTVWPAATVGSVVLVVTLGAHWLRAVRALARADL